MRRIVLNRRRLAAGAAILAAVFAAAAAFRQWVLPYCVSLPEEELALLVDFCQCELFGQVTNWLNQNMVYDIVAHVQALCRLFEGSIAQALEAAPMEA